MVFVVLDDVGYSDLGSYGSEILTPHMDRLAREGVRFTNFHVTAMCSPTRASLLTGRNAHSVGVGIVAEWANGLSGYDGRIYPTAGTVPEVLRLAGFHTMAVGKWHLAHTEEYGAAGPFSNWPLGKGFDRWYGYHGSLSDSFFPELNVDNQPIHLNPPEDYHLSEDLVGRAIEMVRDHCTSAPERPFFLYLAFGACHWPHHAPKAYIDRFRGHYDQGWDATREERFRRQLAMGLFPESTTLAPRNGDVAAWCDVQKDSNICRLSTRLQEAYAGFLAHTDDQVGRFVAYLESIGQLDNTILVLLSDNGASAEGGPTGAINLRKHMVYEPDDPEIAIRHIDKIGSADAYNHYPTGWAQVSNTPLKWYKKDTHGGGVRAPLIVRWPQGVEARGELRTQFHHVIDIAPTVYDWLGVKMPEVINGIEQQPLHGVSMRYAIEDAKRPTTRSIQHFELLGDRALWHDGWKAVTRHVKGRSIDDDVWELYHLNADFSETNDLAESETERLERLRGLWLEEAQKYSVLPIDDREWERAAERMRAESREYYDYFPGMARIDRLMAPDVTGRGFRIEAELLRGNSAPQGVLFAWGSCFGGLVLYIKDAVIVLEYIFSQDERTVLHCTDTQQPGSAHVSAMFRNVGNEAFEVTLGGTGLESTTARIPRTWPTHGMTAGVSCGMDAGHPVSDAYPRPFIFPEAVLRRVRVIVEPGAPQTPKPTKPSLFAED